MLALSFSQPQGYPFGSSKMTGSDPSPGGPMSQPPLHPPTMMSRRSLCPQSTKRPKLSLQTAILPQPVSPALPLPCSADTPTTRNTLANSFRSPATGVEKREEKVADVREEVAPCPYGPEATSRSILKNTPLARLIRSRRAEKQKRTHGKVRIAFVEEPQVIPRPAQDAGAGSDGEQEEVDITPNKVEDKATVDTTGQDVPAGNRPRSNSVEWRRRHMQRTVNEGRELSGTRRGAGSIISSTAETPISASSGSVSTGPAGVVVTLPERPPQTPETPSPRRTRDWVWTLGDDFSSPSTYDQPSSAITPSTEKPADAKEENAPFVPKRLTRVPTGFYPTGSDAAAFHNADDTPSTSTTPMTPLSLQTAASSQPETPITPGSAALDDEQDGAATIASVARITRGPSSSSPSPSPLKIQVPIRGGAPLAHGQKDPLTPRSVPLPETPKEQRY